MLELAGVAPVLKWAGGKAGLLGALDARMPPGIKHRRHVEPFIGGGALFFAHAPRVALIADANEKLVRTYQALRADVSGVIRALVALARVHDEPRYYAVRERLNDGIADDIEHAATFIYINRTCFNGQHRENAAGRFNTSMGDTPRSGIVAPDKLRAAARVLVGADVRHQDFETTMSDARRGDFLFLDPPYVPVVDTVAPSFVGYVAGGFGDADHVRLLKAWKAADARGVLCMQTNADVPRVHELYRGFRIERIIAPRAMGAAGRAATTAREVVIRNY